MQNNKRINIWITVMLAVFAVGAVAGVIYAGGMASDASEELRVYLTEYFENGARGKREIFLTSLFDNLKVFAVIFMAGFFRAGLAVSLGMCLAEGFVSGFTGAVLIRLLGLKGFLMGASSILSVIVFVTALVIYGAYSVNFGVSGRKSEYGAKKEYFIFSIIALTIFCIASFFDGYITTTFMDFIVNKM